jgi:hypothetical protein
MPPRKRTAPQNSSLVDARAAKRCRTAEHNENNTTAEVQLHSAPDKPKHWRTRYNTSQALLCSATRIKKAAEQDIRRKTTKINKLEYENTQLRSEKTYLDSNANTAQYHLGQLQQRHNLVLQLLEQVNVSYSSALCIIVKLNANLENAQGEVTRLQKVEVSLRTTLEALKSKNQNQKHELKKLHAREERAKEGPPIPAQKRVFALRKGRKAGGDLHYKTELVLIELIRLGIPSSQVFRTILCCAELFDCVVLGNVSESTIRSIILAAGVAGRLQIADAMINCDTATFSSNSTSHKSISYLASHITAMTPDMPECPKILALPITTLDNHTSQGQLDTIANTIREILSVYTRCFTGKITLEYWKIFITKMVGGMTDHASDQKLLIKLIMNWKRLIDRELRGQNVLLAEKSPVELLQMISDHLHSNDSVPVDWKLLPEDEQAKLVAEAWRSICIPFGEDAYSKLSPAEQRKVDMFIWSGCSMHKSLNTTKAGYDAMTAEWPKLAGAAPPARLITKDNRATLKKGSEDETERIHALSKGGAAKHNEIMGMVMNNKDDKKGQQDVFRNAYEV